MSKILRSDVYSNKSAINACLSCEKIYITLIIHIHHIAKMFHGILMEPKDMLDTNKSYQYAIQQWLYKLNGGRSNNYKDQI